VAHLSKEGLVTDGNFFTRATWRSGKKRRLRKRTKPYGGCKTAPAAFLEAAKQTQFRPGRPGGRLCSAVKRDGSPCGRLALKELRVCEAHGGCSILARQKKLQPTGRTAVFKATRVAAVEGRSPPAPLELTRLPVYRQANEWARMRMIRAWGTSGWLPLVLQIQHQGIWVWVLSARWREAFCKFRSVATCSLGPLRMTACHGRCVPPARLTLPGSKAFVGGFRRSESAKLVPHEAEQEVSVRS
jgi:hypothetical protein